MQIDRNIILRAWKDEQYLASLPADVREALPPRPQAYDELSSEQLEHVAGGTMPTPAVVTAYSTIGWATAAVDSAVRSALTDD